MSHQSQLTTYGPDSRDLPTLEDRPSAVLLVARNVALGDTCRRKLSDAGIDVVLSTKSTDQARELIDQNHLFDAVVISVNAGDVESAMLAQHMRRFHSDTPTLVMTSVPNLRMSGIEEATQLDNVEKLKKVVFGAGNRSPRRLV